MKTYVSAYPTLSTDSDSMTIFLINRHTTATKDLQIDVRNFTITNEPIQLYTLSELPSDETFVSHVNNALKVKQIDITADNDISVQLEPLSVNALVLRGELSLASEMIPAHTGLKVFPNPSRGALSIEFNLEKTSQVRIELYNGIGQKMATLSNSQSFVG